MPLDLASAAPTRRSPAGMGRLPAAGGVVLVEDGAEGKGGKDLIWVVKLIHAEL